MLYLFTGTDNEKVRTKAFSWIAAARTKAPDALYVRLSADTITPEVLDEVSSTQGLFFSKMLVLLDDPFSHSGAGEMVLEHLKALSASPNPVAILAPKLLAARSKKIEALAEKVFTIDVHEKKITRGFNSALVNALSSRNGTLLWQELKIAERQGDAPEMLHGLLHWKARDLMEKGGRVWSKEEAQALSLSLIELLSDSRSGALPLSMQLERFALAL